ncbi:MAG: BRCT domain-containing protein [Nitrospirota bacterium]
MEYKIRPDVDDDDKISDKAIHSYGYKRVTDRMIDELIGICKGILSDNMLNDKEVTFLSEWLDANRLVCNKWPGDVLYARISRIMSDNIIDEEELKEVGELLLKITGGSEMVIDDISRAVVDISTNLPFDNPPPTITFPNNFFCLTGDFLFGSRKDCESIVTIFGGAAQKDVTKKTNYVIVGSLGSPEWIHSSHGRKIEKAVAFKNAGQSIGIVAEKHWVSQIGAIAEAGRREA